MAHSSSIKLCVVIVLVSLVTVANSQTTYTVLDNTGWAIPSTQNGARAYETWAASKNFTVGDSLIFNFITGRHNVVQVTKKEFDSCTALNSIAPITMTGPVNITLDTAGEYYYICTFSGHCSLGQKLMVSVSGSMGPATGTSPSGGGRGGSSNTPTRTSPTIRTSPTVRRPRTSDSDDSAASEIVTGNRLLVLGASLLVFLVSALSL